MSNDKQDEPVVTKEIAIMDAIIHHYSGLFAVKIQQKHVKDHYNIDVTEDDIKGVKNLYEEWRKQHYKGKNEDTLRKDFYNHLVSEQKSKKQKENAEKLKSATKAEAQAIKSKWEKATYAQQVERKRWNEKGKEEADKKAATAKTNRNYFIKRQKEVLKSNQQTFKMGIYNPKTGKYDKTVNASRSEYLAHLRNEKKRWEAQYLAQLRQSNNYATNISAADAKIKAFEDAEKANSEKKKLNKDGKNNLKAIPREVANESKKLGNDYKLVTLHDSKGNRIFSFEKDGKPAYIMTQAKGQKTSALIDSSLPKMQEFVQQAKDSQGKNGANFTPIIKEIADFNKRQQSVKNSLAFQVAPVSKDLSGEEVIKGSALKEAEARKGVRVAATGVKADKIANVTLVPHIKRSGKPSKKNFDIQLTDSDGKTFVLTKKMVKEAIKNESIVITSNGQVVDRNTRALETWDKYVEMAQKGQLKPETVASFFKEEKPRIAKSGVIDTHAYIQSQGGRS